MELLRILAIFIAPPLAVMDKGCGAILLVCLILCVFGWIPSSITACLICIIDNNTDK